MFLKLIWIVPLLSAGIASQLVTRVGFKPVLLYQLGYTVKNP